MGCVVKTCLVCGFVQFIFVGSYLKSNRPKLRQDLTILKLLLVLKFTISIIVSELECTHGFDRANPGTFDFILETAIETSFIRRRPAASFSKSFLFRPTLSRSRATAS